MNLSNNNYKSNSINKFNYQNNISIHGCLRSRPYNNRYNDLYNKHDDFIHDLFMRKYKFDNNNYNLSYDKKYFEKNLYLITMHFRPNSYAAKNASSMYNSAPLFSSFKAWHLKSIQTVMGDNARKFSKLQPFSLAFLDVEGSAYGQAASTFQIPHIHACLLVKPENQDDFEKHLLSEEAESFKDGRITKIDIIQFKDDGRGIRPMLTYASKYARQQQTNPRHCALLENYPDIESKYYPFYSFNEKVQKNQRFH